MKRHVRVGLLHDSWLALDCTDWVYKQQQLRLWWFLDISIDYYFLKFYLCSTLVANTHIITFVQSWADNGIAIHLWDTEYVSASTNVYTAWHHNTCLSSAHRSRRCLDVIIFALLATDSCILQGFGWQTMADVRSVVLPRVHGTVCQMHWKTLTCH